MLISLFYRENDSEEDWKILLNIDNPDDDDEEEPKSDGSNRICINIDEMASEDANNNIIIRDDGKFCFHSLSNFLIEMEEDETIKIQLDNIEQQSDNKLLNTEQLDSSKICNDTEDNSGKIVIPIQLEEDGINYI